MLEARAIHTGRSGYDHLRVLALTHGIPMSRVAEVIRLVGLDVARTRVGSFSLGMGQRLGIAAALLGDAQTVILMSRSTALILRGFAGSVTCSRVLREKDAPSFSPRT